MANYVSIQKKIDRGRGIAGRVLGQPYNVYRIGQNAALNLIDPFNRVTTNFPVLRRRISAKDQIEAPERMGTLFFELVANADQYLVGDVFVQNDQVYGTGDTSVDFSTNQLNAFCLAFHAPIKKTLGARLDKQVQFYRPSRAPATRADGTQHWVNTQENMLPLVLFNGVLSLGAAPNQDSLGFSGSIPYQLGGSAPSATAALIPVGFQTAPNMRGGLYKKIPGDVGTQHWYCYVPPLPDGPTGSFRFVEGDRIVDQDGARYAVRHPYRQDTGFSGSMLVIEREVGA